MQLGIALFNALRSVDVPDDKAMDVVNALEKEMQQHLATKQDLAILEQKLSSTLYRGLLFQTMAIAGLVIAIVKLL
ncbi:hypothetical protein [Halomonas elongata]|uniref:DUF1640 domain-containing protein n=1 Tax=Halomonas elongata (strain ATCC 33173 / DSM 2581 / NBRC 15536 / NCIMB 2198 / 1H9) TaxID=768066 RepID=A0A1R4A4I7_HALED|nr:hypothetical protein [Halomonas elongata]WBF17711.1 hypothetical protein LM502_16795 [Halomonas elongata]WPU46552.1 hypothetical protein SR933_15030 [Halomonas elongata DSM 2581]SJK83873.1 uncharacterized protein HELO_4080A [Halomonas elongata DSM 2581]